MADTRPPLLLTRPQAQAERFAAGFAARFGADWPVVHAPLLQIREVPLTLDPLHFDGLIFTSENAVEVFARNHTARHWPVWCVGPRTAQTAADAGFAARSAGGDAAALIRAFDGVGRWLHLRGEHAAGDLAGNLLLAGTDMAEAVIYAQDALPLTSAALGLLARTGPVLVPLFSPRTATLFAAAATGARADLWIVGLSRAVAQAYTGPRARLDQAAQPNGASMLDKLDEVLRQEGCA